MGEIYVTLKTVRRRKITSDLLVITGTAVVRGRAAPEVRMTPSARRDSSQEGQRPVWEGGLSLWSTLSSVTLSFILPDLGLPHAGTLRPCPLKCRPAREVLHANHLFKSSTCFLVLKTVASVFDK